MNILIEIGHPAHVHFFAKSLSALEKKGVRATVVTRNKEITNALLDKLGIPYKCLSQPKKGALPLLKELVWRWWQVASILRRQKIKLAVSISGISTSLPARLLGVRNLTFTDTEDALISNLIAFPFSDKIFTPTFFLRNLGRKHARYKGLHELSYLQDFDFEAAKNIRKTLGIPKTYSVLRFVANDALHDWNLKNISVELALKIQKRLNQFGEVFITSQSPLPKALQSYQLNAPIENIHTILSGAQCFVGDSPTMAVESSLLGTPAFLVSQRVGQLGNMVGLEKEFKLLRNFETWESLEKELQQINDLGAVKQKWAHAAQAFRDSMPSTTQLVTQLILGELKKCVA